jgi:NADPH:quinone reductase-like Zn-dependent oxidoreductase
MARVVAFDEIGGPEVLKIIDLPIEDPGPAEVRLNVEAIGINRLDQIIRSGNLFPPAFPRARLGVEAAGVIDAIGHDVRDLAVGDEVIVTAVPNMDVNGTYADYVNLAADAVIHRAGRLDAVHAAATWVAYFTAYGALIERARVRPADTVFITAASSAVGLAAIQIANQIGAVPIAMTRSVNKKADLLRAGATAVVVADEGDATEAVRSLTGGAGADIVVDSVAGPGLPDLARAAKSGGTVVVLGWLDARPALLPMNWLLTVTGYARFEHNTDPTVVARIAAFLDAGLRTGALKPTIAKVFDLEHIVDAHRYLESGEQLGKVVVA